MDFRRLGTRIRYHINDLLIRNPLWQILVLVIVSSIIVSAGVGMVGNTVEHGFWWSFTRLLDQGTFVNDVEEGSEITDYRTVVVGVFVTMGGILVLSVLIGIFSSKIAEQLDRLKKGKSPIVEKNHFIVCGNGDRLFEVTRELVKAKLEGSTDGGIVLFSGESREKLEEILVQRIGKKYAKKIICRSGDPTDIDALDLPGFDSCKGFVVVGDRDSTVIKTLIAIKSITKKDYRPNGVCELRNKAKSKIAQMAYSDVNLILVREIVMRLLVQVGRQPGLSKVYSEILSFDGNEFYIESFEGIQGLTITEVSRRMSGGVVSGIIREKEVILNPSGGVLLREEDSLLILEENRGSCHLRKTGTYKAEFSLEKGRKKAENPKRMLVLSGESRNISFMLKLLDDYSDPGSEIVIAGSIPRAEGLELLGKIKYTNCKKSYIKMERTDPEAVEELHPENYDSIMVISGKSSEMSDEEADSECIITLLVIRDIALRIGNAWSTTVVSEIRNPKNRRLATAAGIDDFVISNEVCSMVMAQLVIQPDLRLVYNEIFDPSGCEIQLRDAYLYTAGNFADVMVQGAQNGEVVLGWLTGTGCESVVTLNPPAGALLPVDPGTRMVVIAER